ncbi:MAG: hypothetical protein H5T86_01870 [Armatimonadetes bacterium]|nr:hypothetical protein [Armatimonadota bacterium]
MFGILQVLMVIVSGLVGLGYGIYAALKIADEDPRFYLEMIELGGPKAFRIWRIVLIVLGGLFGLGLGVAAAVAAIGIANILGSAAFGY